MTRERCGVTVCVHDDVGHVRLAIADVVVFEPARELVGVGQPRVRPGDGRHEHDEPGVGVQQAQLTRRATGAVEDQLGDALSLALVRNVYGGVFALDPWELYGAGLLQGPNMLVLGLKGYGKSALCKTWIFRQRVFGRRIEVIERNGEYGPVIDSMGGVSVRPPAWGSSEST